MNDSKNGSMKRAMDDSKERVLSTESYTTSSTTSGTASYTVSCTASSIASYTASPTEPSTAIPVIPSTAPVTEFSKRNLFIGTTLIIIGLLWLFTLVSGPIQKAYSASNEFVWLSTNEHTIRTAQIAADAGVVLNIQSDEVLFYKEGAIGTKTGFTDGAGYCLVSAAEQKDREIIVVVLHSTKEQVWTDSHSLLKYGFDIK